VTGNAANLGTLTLANSGGVAANGINVGSLALNNTGGVVEIGGALVATSLATVAQNYAIAFNGGASVTNATTFSNTGGVSLGNDAADISTFTGGLTSTASTTNIGGALRTGGQAINLGAVALTADAGLDSTNNGANVTGGAISLSAVTGNGRDLTFNAGTNGALAANGALSNVGALNVARASNAIFTNAVTATSVTTGAGTYGMALNGGATVTNAATFNNTGGVTLGNDAGDVTSFGGGVISTASTTSAAGTIRTAGQAMAFGPLALTGDVGLDSTNNGANAAGGAITLGAINGTGRALAIRSGASALALNGSIGSLGRLGTFDVVNSGSIALGSGLTLTAGATQLRTAGAITGGTVDVAALSVAASSVRFSDIGNLVNGRSGADAATQVTMLTPVAIGQGPYMINGVPFTTAPLPPVATNPIAVVDQVAQLVRTPTISSFTQPTAPTVTTAPRSGGASASSLGAFEPAAGPESGGSQAISDDPSSDQDTESNEDEETTPAAKRGRTSE
jgi:hypothetical protein